MKPRIIRNLKKDKLIAKCEKLLVRGDSITDISEQLNISYGTAKGYVELVKTRWTDSKDIKELQAERENLIRKIQAVIKECWELRNSARNSLEANTSLRTILLAVEQLRRLQGLDLAPPTLDEPDEIKIFKMAQEVNQLPKEEYKVALQMIRTEITKRNKA